MMLPPDMEGRPARILIVDDERNNRQLLEAMLGAEGYELVTAISGEEALALVAQHPPDLILLDVMMPGMDGYEVAAKVKSSAATKNIPIIIVTALDDRNARMFGLNAGAEDFLTKPVDRLELSVRVRNLLRLKAYGDYHDKYSLLLEKEVDSRTAELSDSERLYRSTFDAAPVGIVHMDMAGRWVRVNQRLCQTLGYSQDALRDGDLAVLLQLEDAPGEAEARDQLAAGTLDRYVVEEKLYRCCDGGGLWARVSMSTHRDAAGTPQHFILVIANITEQRALEARVRQTSKMDAIGRLASGVAHDFSNMVTVILGFGALLSGDTSLTVQQRKDLNEMIKAAERASVITKQLLTFSRQQPVNAGPLDINALIGEMARMLAPLLGAAIAVSLDPAADLPLALGDRGQIEQVVMNLVVNARDAMPEGGAITISSADVVLENSSFHNETVAPGPYVMLSVTDSGSGMSADTQQHLFEPFFTTKKLGEGTGLGLSIVYGIVKQNFGYIWVYSEAGRGTTFKVYLPHVVPPTVAAPTPAAHAFVPSETLLLVDDEPTVRTIASLALKKAGYRVIEAAGADEAEAAFAAHSGDIQLMVSDVVMPGRTGPELFAALRSRAPNLKVVFMSGYTRLGSHLPIFDAECSFLEKPFTAESLALHVRNALDLRGRQ